MYECHCGSIVHNANRWKHNNVACSERKTNTKFYCDPCEATFSTAGAFYRHKADTHPMWQMVGSFAQALKEVDKR
jgi:hypothetical protein